MAQVVTNENIQQLIETRRVDEYVPPKAEAKTEKGPEATSIDSNKSIDVEDGDKKEQPRGDDGKFVKTEAEKPESEKAPPKSADDEDDADLPERVRRQIGKKHRAMKEAEEWARARDREAAVAEARAEALERELQALRGTKSGPVQDKKDGPPNPEDFKTVAEYADALVEYKMEQKLLKTREEAFKKQQEASDAQAQSEFIKRIEKVRETIEDYDEVVAGADIIVPPHIAQHITESDIGPLLGYHLAKNPSELERLSKLSPIRAIAELGKLELSLEKKPEPKAEAKTPAISKAPSPILPLEGKSTPVTKDPSEMSFQELRAFRESQRRAKGGRG